jgi:hypothetical protein
MFDIAKLKEMVITHQGKTPCGVSCSFIKLNDRWGIKKYYDKEKRNDNYKRQRHMASVGLAPKVGPKFHFEDMDIYCYVSEAVQVLIEAESVVINWEKREREHRAIYDSIEIMGWIRKAVNDMMVAGYQMTDTHAANFGILGNRVICIDFGND